MDAPSRWTLVIAGAALAIVAVAVNIPYAALISLFDYDDVLRRTPGEVLQLFHAGGAPLIWAWWAFGISALALAMATSLLGGALRALGLRADPAVTMFGVLSGILQAAALFRWTFAVPQLARSWAAAEAGSPERAAAEAVYVALNGFGGMAIGEHLGQLLLVLWTLGIGLALWGAGGLLRWIGLAGCATVPVWMVGQTELLGAVIPGVPVVEVIPYAFMAWEAWLLILGVALIAVGMRKESAGPEAAQLRQRSVLG